MSFKMAPRRNGHTLARVNFPPYAVHALSERHILVAGGGGQANTGIKNIIEIYELLNDGSTCRAESVMHYDTGRHVIMNCTAMHNGKHFVLAAGIGGSCQIYQMKYKIIKDDEEPSGFSNSESGPQENSVRRRHSVSNGKSNDSHQTENSKEAKGKPLNEAAFDANGNTVIPQIGFDLQPLETFQTDFNSKEDPFQKVVRFTSDCSVMLTAGSDGHIRVWKYPEFQKLYEIEAHTNEIDDLDIIPTDEKVVSVSRDGHGYIWNLCNGTKHCELEYMLPNGSTEKYNFRSCRYGIVEGDRKNVRLYTSLIPCVRKKPALPCYLFKWDAQKYIVEKVVSTGSDMLSAMAVSDDGRFVGLGTLNGTVDIYIAFSLQRLYHMENSHSFFVTGVEFLKSSAETKRITGEQDVSLISVSVDNHITAHHVSKQATTGLVGIFIFFVIFLLLIYILLDFLNL